MTLTKISVRGSRIGGPTPEDFAKAIELNAKKYYKYKF